MDEVSAKKLCKEGLATSEELRAVGVVAYPKGEFIWLEYNVTPLDDASRKFYAEFATVSRGMQEEMEQRYGSLNYIIYNFARFIVILIPMKDSLLIGTANAETSPNILTALVDRAKEFR